MRLSTIDDIDIVTLIKAADAYMCERRERARGVWLAYTSTRHLILIAEVVHSDARTKETHELGHVLYVEAHERKSNIAGYAYVEAYTFPVIKRFKRRVKIA